MIPFRVFQSSCMQLAALVISMTCSAAAQAITTFDVPGAIDTLPMAISSSGDVTGFFADANNRYHAFIRGRRGAMVTFDITADQTFVTPVGFGRAGEIAGFYQDANYGSHGFIRSKDGSITTFDAPGGTSGNAASTQVNGINSRGEIVGVSSQGGFLRNANGTFAEITLPWSGNLEGWSFDGINSGGQIAGLYADDSRFFAFIRRANGKFLPFAVHPGILGKLAMSRAGQVSGSYLESNGFVHGFVRKTGGIVGVFDAPGASRSTGSVGCGHCSGTLATAANQEGLIVGFFGDVNNRYHGFLRYTNGTIITFDAVADPKQPITPRSINASGQIAGYYEEDGHAHGFIRDRCTNR